MKPFMTEGQEGTLWFADSSRVFSSPKGSEDPRTWIEHPLPAPWTGKVYITAIARHKDGSIWIAAYRNSDSATVAIAARYDGKTWSVDTPPSHPGTSWICSATARAIYG